MRRLTLFLSVMLSMTPCLADAPSGDKIIAAMKRQFSAVNDYRADVAVTVKGPKVSINNMQMTVYYKKPNKIHVDAKQGLAMIPSGNYFGDPLGHLGSVNATYQRSVKKHGRECHVLSIPGGRGTVTLWVDKERLTTLAMDSEDGLRTVWRYALIEKKYYMPSQIAAEIKAPIGMDAYRHRGPGDKTSGETGPTKVTIRFSNYKVNKGIDDKVFQEKKPK